jgi:predicted kinase
MPPTALVIVTGHPATGKTTLARHLAGQLALPLLSKDALKETIFDTLGWGDRQRARQVGVAALALLYQLAEELLAAGCAPIVESNFRPDLDTARMRALQARRPFRPVQLRCVAAPEVMAERYLARIRAGQRHPGHCEPLDAEASAMLRALGPIAPLDIGGALRTVDTTVPAALDLDAITVWVRRAIHEA